MGTGASLQNAGNNSSAKKSSSSNARKPLGPPVKIDGRPYMLYPAHCSASLRPNNLSTLDDTFVYTCKNRVVFVQNSSEKKLENTVFRSDGTVFQTKGCVISGANGLLRVIVVAQTSGLVLWNFDEQKRISKHTIAESEFSEKNQPFARGITCSENQILVGTSSGRVMIFSHEGNLLKNLNIGDSAVNDLVYFRSPDDKKSQLAVAAADGSVTIWASDASDTTVNLSNDYVIHPPSPYSFPITVATMRNNTLLVAGFTCGRIRIFSTESKCLIAEIAAHARPISSLCVSRHRSQILSCGEDSIINLWSVSPDDISLDFSEKIENTLVVGAVFTGEEDNTIAATAYDYAGVFMYKIPTTKTKVAQEEK